MTRLVILAAGASRRLGECKALADLGGRCGLERLLAAGTLAFGPAPVVITGAHDEPIRAWLRDAGARGAAARDSQVLFNPDWERGRLGGVAQAARAFPGESFCIAPVDVPLVDSETFDALSAEWAARKDPPGGWLAPRFEPPDTAPRFGHPIVVGRALLESLSSSPSAWPPETPLRALRAHADPLWSIAVDDPAIVDDLDTPADLATIRKRIAGQ